MDMGYAANIAEIIGGIAIIISLIYVGYQIRQSTKVAIAENTRVVLDTYRHWQFLAANPDISDCLSRGYQDFEALSHTEKGTFHAVLHPLFNQMENVQVQYAMGHLNEAIFNGWMLSCASLISTPGGSQWWSTASKAFSDDFGASIEQQIRSQNIDSETFYSLYPYFRVEEVSDFTETV